MTTNPIVLLAPAAGMEFIAMPSGTTYVSNAYGIVMVTSGSVADQQALIAAGCTALLPNAGGIASTQPGTAYTVQASDQNNAIVFTSASNAAVTLPNSLPQGFAVTLWQGAAGVVSASAAAGGSVVTPNGTSTLEQYGALYCLVISNTTGANAQWAVVAEPTNTGSGLVGASTLSSLYTQDSTAHYPQYSVAQVFSDTTTANDGTWLKTGAGNGSGNWTQVSSYTLAALSALITAETTRAEAAEAFLQAQIPGGTTTQGTYPAPTESGSSGFAYTWFPDTPIEYTGLLESVSVAMQAADASAVLVVASQSSGNMVLQAQVPLPLASGVNTITLPTPIQVEEGWFVGIYTASAGIYYASGGPGAFYTTGVPSGGGTSYTSTGALTMSIGWSLLYGVLAVTGNIENQLEGETGLAIGIMPAQTTSSFSSDSGATDFIMQPFPYDGSIRQVQFYVQASNVSPDNVLSPPVGNGYAALVIATMNSSNQFTLVGTCYVAITAQFQVVDNPVFLTPSGAVLAPIPAGAYLGLWKKASYIGAGGGIGAVSSTLGWRYTSGIPGTNTPSTFVSNTVACDIGCTFDCGAEGRLASLEIGAKGLDAAGLTAVLLNGADPTGTNDSTAALAATQAMRQAPARLPFGQFKASSVPFKAHGFYGPGKLMLTDAYGAPVHYLTPSRETDESLLLKLRSCFSRQISSGSPLMFFGDSITSGFYSGNYDPTTSTYTQNNGTAWLELCNAFLNYDYAPGSYPCSMTPAASGPDTPSMFGMVLSSGVTFGSDGPIGQSYILAAGASITITTYTGGSNVALDQLDVFYKQISGAGSLQFAYNGTVYKTVNCAGSTVTDKFSGPSATGQTAAGVYTITASGGAVTITGIVRLRNPLSAAGTPNPLYFMRFSHGLYTTGNFGSTQVASALAQASNLQAAMGPAGASFQPEAFVALGTNEFGNPSYGISASQYATNLTAIINQLISGGAARVNVTGLIRAQWSVYSGTSGMTANRFDQYLAAMQDVVDSFNGNAVPVRMCKMDGIDFADESLLTELGVQGVHPNGDGHDRYAQRLMEWRAAA